MPPKKQKAPAAPQNATSVAGPDLGLFTTLARTDLFLDALQRESLSPHGLTFSEYSVLRLLQGSESHSLTPSQLAEAIICTTGAMTKIVDRLQRSAFVKRKPNPSDRRAVLVQITRSGERVADRAAATYREGRERVLSELGGDQSAEIHRHLRDLLEAFERVREQATDEEKRAS